MNSVTTRIELFTKDNYDTWKMQVEALLTKNELWCYVSGEKVKPKIVHDNDASVQSHEKWIKNDKKAKADLILSISPSE